MTEEIVHTPTSLYARLFAYLKENDLIFPLSETKDLSRLSPGDFVDFTGTINQSPLSSTLAAYRDLLKLSDVFQAPDRARQGNRQGRSSEASKTADTANQIDVILTAMSSGSSMDLVATVSSDKTVTAVLTSDRSFFIDQTMNDLLDGTFHVVGKVTRVILPGSEDSISLLRKSSLSHLPAEILAQFVEGLGSVMPAGVAVASVPAPAVQAIPIAIFA